MLFNKQDYTEYLNKDVHMFYPFSEFEDSRRNQALLKVGIDMSISDIADIDQLHRELLIAINQTTQQMQHMQHTFTSPHEPINVSPAISTGKVSFRI